MKNFKENEVKNLQNVIGGTRPPCRYSKGVNPNFPGVIFKDVIPPRNG